MVAAAAAEKENDLLRPKGRIEIYGTKDMAEEEERSRKFLATTTFFFPDKKNYG